MWNFDQAELLTFFALLVRVSVLIALAPIFGDRMVPAPLKILLSLSMCIILFPILTQRGVLKVEEAWIWGATTFGIAKTLTLEVMVGLAVGFIARLLFDSIQFGANLMGNYMGFSMATTYDPHAEAQTQSVAELQMALAMILFLTWDGHHLILRAFIDSYAWVGIGKAEFGSRLSEVLVSMSSETLRLGFLFAAPVGVSVFAVNVVFGVFSKALPQMNILVLSLGVTAGVGLLVLWILETELLAFSGEVLGRVAEWITVGLRAIGGK
jgi:flagellar biosynthetic protein FliR